MPEPQHSHSVSYDLQVEPKQKQFKLRPADLKVKIEDSKIQEIIVSEHCGALLLSDMCCINLCYSKNHLSYMQIPSSDAGFLAIYQAVGGKMPSKAV